MRDFAAYLLLGEDGFASNWSIMHFLSGAVPHAVWAYWVPGETWVSLYLLAMAACLFELVENTPGAGRIMWSWIGYQEFTYHTDTLRNSVSDIIFLLLGWLVAQLTHMLAPEALAFWVLMGIAAVLFVLFLWLFSKERAKWKAKKGLAVGAGDAMQPATATATRARFLAASVPSIVGGARSVPGEGASATLAATAAKPPPRSRVSFVL
jgi:hypothetical protein